MYKSYAFHPIPTLLFLSALSFALQIAISLPVKPHFDSNLVLMGDAKFTNGSSCIQLTDPGISSPSYGLVIQRKPTKFFTSNTKQRRSISFSSDFTFSISPINGDGLAFLLIPKSCLSKLSRDKFGVSKELNFFGVAFDAVVDDDLSDVNANHVGVGVGRLVYVNTRNVSSMNLAMNSGMKLHSWVDYDSSSKRLEVRLSKFGVSRPYKPLLVYQIDFGEMWKNEDISVAVSSSTGESMQVSRVYSWKFRTRTIPTWLHSKPLDPKAFSLEKNGQKSVETKGICVVGFLSGLVLLFGCGLLLSVLVMILWAMFENNSETILMVPGKCTVHSEDFEYEKINVVVGDDDESGNVKN